MRRMILATAILSLSLLAACAGPTAWQKDGVAADDQQRDMTDCRRQADAQAEREMHGRGAQAPIYDVDPGSGQVRQTFPQQSRSAALSEQALSQQLYVRCMKARGYTQE